MSLGRDGIAGLIVLVLSLVLLVDSLSLPRLAIVPVGAGFYPRIVLTFLAAMSAILVVQDWRRQRRGAARLPAVAAGPAVRRDYALVAQVFAAVGVYVLLLPLLGYRIATVLFVGLLQAVLDWPAAARQWAKLAAVAIGTAAVTYLAFEHYLYVLLPRGTWTGW